ncbi:MAG: ABC transporter substrate binding protein, partial [Victivallaceae bacterium]
MRRLISQISAGVVLLVFFWGGYCQATPSSPTNAATPLDKQYRVLFVPSYNLSYGLTSNISAGLINYFSSSATPITTEYMEIDILWHPQQGQGRFDEILKHISEEKFDLIICGGAPAYNLFAKNIDRLPAGIPIVFCGYFDFDDEIRQRHPEISGIKLQYDLDGAIDMGVKLLPETKSVYIINDFSSGSAELASRLKHKYSALGVNIVYITPENCTTPQMLSKISNMPEKSFLLFANWNRDNNHVIVRIHNLLSQITTVCHKPIFTVNERVLDYCALGGVVEDSEKHGEEVARLAEKILTGTIP